MNRRDEIRRGALAALAAAGLAAAGCAAPPAAAPPREPALQAAIAAGGATDASAQIPAAATDDRARLARLWQQRIAEGATRDFALGPGDVLEISVPLEQLEHREVRVSPADTVSLPLVGELAVGGMNEQQLTAALRERLSKYMRNPPVSLFVKHYGSREVAVVGAVEKPGLYTLTSASDTLMQMMSRAGGATKDAAGNVIFFPAQGDRSALRPASLLAQAASAEGAAARPAAAAGPVRRVPADQRGPLGPEPASDAAPDGAAQSSDGGSTAALARLHPIGIGMADPRAQAYLEMPARPGDVLLVPAAGEVTVGGWVKKPGAYQVTPGMTALSAISAAGGAMFSSAAEVLRTGADGQREGIAVDISRVQRGEASDVAVQSGDVVMVDRSALGALPYAVYEVFDKFGTGMYLPIP